MVLLPAARKRLLVVTRNPAMLAMIDTDSGRTVTAVEAAADGDDAWHDAVNDRIYQSGGDGHVHIYQLKAGSDSIDFLGSVPTAPVARTSYFDSDQRRLYVGVPYEPSLAAAQKQEAGAARYGGQGELWVYAAAQQ